jgi:hypothetical protein
LAIINAYGPDTTKGISYINHQENHKKKCFCKRKQAMRVEILWVMFFIGEGVLKRQKVLNQ